MAAYPGISESGICEHSWFEGQEKAWHHLHTVRDAAALE